jgi:hypothetical protein
MIDENRPSSIILFNENLVLAYDFDQNSTEGWIYDVSSNNINAMVVKKSANPRFIQHPGKPNDYYMMMDGDDDMLEVYHTDALLLGENNGDYTISFSFL